MATRRNISGKETFKGALPVALAFALMQAAGTSVGFAQQGVDTAPDTAPADQHITNESTPNDTAPNFTDEEFVEGHDDAFGDSININDEFFVELHVKDDDLATVLEMLSIQSQRNIIMSANVSATVTANLYGVTFYQALDAILHVNGFGYLEKGNFIYVYTIDELTAIQEASRERVFAVVDLNYLTSVDAAEFVSPLLSDGGQIVTNGRVNPFTLPADTPVGADDYALGARLVIHDFQENIDEIEDLVMQIDTRPAQVLVEATVLQASINEANAFGIDFSIVSDINITDFIGAGGPLGAANGLVAGEGNRLAGGTETPVSVPGTGGEAGAIASNVGNIEGPATLKAGVVNGDFAVFLRLLDEVTDTTIMANPKILSLNRQPARVLVGKKVGYLSTTSTDTATTQTVEFLDTGTQLYFRPFVTNEGLIRMELKPQVSDAIIRTVTDVQGSAVTIPDELTNELTANVMVRDGQTIVLGGLFREAIVATRRQIPVLGDIPILGAPFRGHDDETTRDEIIFMITPTVVTDDILADQGRRALEYTENVRAGSRRGLLPFSRERQSSQLLVEARNLARQGKTDRALHCIQRAIELKPTASEAFQLRAELLNEHEIWPSNSMLEDIVNNDVADALGLKSEDFKSYFEIMEQETEPEEQPEHAGGFSTPHEGAGIYGDNWQAEHSDGFIGFESDEPVDEFGADEFDADQPESDEFAEVEEPQAAADGTFFCDFDDAPVGEVFNLFSAYSGKQFVASSEVDGAVNAQMSDVEWQEAFDAIMHVNGWTYEEHGQFVYVYTQTEWDTMQAAIAEREAASTAVASAEEPANDEFAGESFAENAETPENTDEPEWAYDETSDEWTQESDSSNEAGAFAAGAAAGAAANEASDAFSGESFTDQPEQFNADAPSGDQATDTTGEEQVNADSWGDFEPVSAEEASSEEREARAQALSSIFRESWQGFQTFAQSAGSWYGRMSNVLESDVDAGQ